MILYLLLPFFGYINDTRIKLENECLPLTLICNFYNQQNQNYPNQQLRGQQKPTRNVIVNSVGFIGGPDSNRDGPIRKMWLLYRRFVAYMEVKRNGKYR